MPEPVSRDEALRGLRALAFLHESGRLADRETVIAADNIFIDMGLGHLSLPYLEREGLDTLDVLWALRGVLADEFEPREGFRSVGPYWPFAY